MLTLESPAKINWFLQVLRRRDDGYHDIYTVMQKVSLCDTLRFEKIDSDEIEVISSLDIPKEDNLVYRAARLLKEYTRYKRGIRIFLEKRIPPQAGLGGGSSNAATTLVGLNRLWDTGIGDNKLSELAASIGSDVAFFLNGSMALAEGRGEIITPIPNQKPGITLLLVKPDFGVSTADAYRNIKEFREKDPLVLKRFLKSLRSGELKALSSVIFNDLEAPVFTMFPLLKDLKETMLRAGAVTALLSGSGSCVFGLFTEHEAAQKASQHFTGLWHAVVETI